MIALLGALGAAGGLAACAGSEPDDTTDPAPTPATDAASSNEASIDAGARDTAVDSPSEGVPPPTGLVPSAGDTTVSLRWNPTNAGTSYRIYRSTTLGNVGALVATSTIEQHIDTMLVNGTPYWYAVSSVRDGVEGAPSAQVSATPKGALPPAPIGLRAIAGDASVALDWLPLAGATYKVLRSLSDATPGVQIGRSAVERYTDSTAANGTTYWYTVTAIVGGSEGPASNPPVSATPRAPRLGKIIFSAGLHTGNFANDPALTGATGVARADSFCMRSSVVPPGPTYKALLVDGVNRDAVAQVDWVLSPNTRYYQVDGRTLIAQTTALAVFDVQSANLTNPIAPGAGYAWTGVGSNQWAAGTHCNEWSTSSAGLTGQIGTLGRVNAQAIGVNASSVCFNPAAVYCVEQ